MPNLNDVTVSLYQQVSGKNEMEYILHSHLQPESNGQVVFNNLTSGTYFLKSSLSNAELYPQLFENTYYTNSLVVDNATPITISNGNVFVANLNHQTYQEVTGTNTAEGYVGVLDSKSITGIPEQVVVLYNVDTDETIDISITDQDGYYFFENVPDYTNIELFVSSFDYPQHSSFEMFTNELLNYSASFILDNQQTYPFEESGITNPQINSFKTYPNPTSSTINIYSDLQITDISITDLNGRIVLSSLTNTSNIDVSSLMSGVYFIRISTPNGVFNKKFIKQ